MSSKLTQIQDALPSDDFTVGGEGWNQIIKILKNINVESEEDLTINTKIKWQSGKLVLLDAGAPFSHEVIIDVENIVTGDPRHLVVRAYNNTTDYIGLEKEPQTFLAKTLGDNAVANSEAKFGKDPNFQGYTLDRVGILKIEDTGDRNVQVISVSNTTPNTYFEFLSSYNTSNHAALSGATDIKVRWGHGSEIDSYEWWSQADGSNAKILSVSETLFDIPATTVDFHNSTINNILLGKSQVPSTIVHTDQNNTYSDFSQFFRNTRMRIRNPANSASMILDVPAITGDRTVSFPLIGANDTFALLGVAQTFTDYVTFRKDASDILHIYRPSNGAVEWGIHLDAWSSTGVQRTYGLIKTGILDATNTSEDGYLAFQVMFGGLLTTRLMLNNNGNMYIGASPARAIIDITGLATSDKTFSLPNVSGNFVIDTHTNVFMNKQKIQWNASPDQLTLHRGNAAAINSLAGIQFDALNGSSAEIIFATMLAGSGPNAADIVAGTEKGQIQLQIRDGGSLSTKLQIRSTTLETFGMVPTFTVGASDLNSMFIYRPVNSSGSSLINFDLQNISSVKKTFGYIGVRSETVTAGVEVGSIQLGVVQAGTLQLEAKLQDYKLWLYNSAGFNAQLDPTGLTVNRVFTFPDLAGQLVTINAAQTLTGPKTLTAPVINGGALNGQFTGNDNLEFIRDQQAGVAEIIARWRLAGLTSSYIQFDNASAVDSVFSPRITAVNSVASNNSTVGLYEYVNIAATSDTADSTNAVKIFDVRRSDGGGTAIQFRRLFQFRNAATNVFEIYVDKFDFTAKKLTNAVINLDEVTMKTSAGSAAGDIPYFDGTRYNRKAQGSNNQFLGVVAGVLGYYTPTVGGVLALGALTDDTSISSPTDGEFLVYNGTTSKWRNLNASSLGEVNTASNVGSTGVGLFKTKSTFDLQFYKIASADNKLTVALSGTDFLQLTINEANMSIANMTGSIGDSRITALAWGKLTSVPTTFAPSGHAASHLSNGSDAIGMATTSIRGTVELATDGETAANVVVQGSDGRLADSRVPLGHVASHLPTGSDVIRLLSANIFFYTMFLVGSTYYVVNNFTGVVESSNTDPTVTLQWLITNSAGKPSLIKSGTYQMTAELNCINKAFNIWGEGYGTSGAAGAAGGTIIQANFTGAANGSMFDCYNTGYTKQYFRNMCIDCNNNTDFGIDSFGVRECEAWTFDVSIIRAKKSGHRMEACWQNSMYNPNIISGTSPVASSIGIEMVRGVSPPCNTIRVYGGKVSNNDINVSLDGTNDIAFFGTILEGFGVSGIKTFNNANANRFYGCSLEYAALASKVSIDEAGNANLYHGCRFDAHHTGYNIITVRAACRNLIFESNLIQANNGSTTGTIIIESGALNIDFTNNKQLINTPLTVSITDNAPTETAWRGNSFVTDRVRNGLRFGSNKLQLREVDANVLGLYADDGTTRKNFLANAVHTTTIRNAGSTDMIEFPDGTKCDFKTRKIENGVMSGLKTTVNAKTADYTALQTDDYIPCTPAANMTITLPAVASSAGKIFQIQKLDNSAFTVTIDGASSEQINGNLTLVLTAQYQSVTLQCNGSAWFTSPYSVERRGKSTASGNGSATVFNLPHGLGVIPHDVVVTCRTHTILTYTADATNIIVTLTAAPANASNNVIFDWSAVP